MAKILVPGVTMKDVEDARMSRALPGNVLDDYPEESSQASHTDMSAPLPSDVLGNSSFEGKECQCIKALAKKLYRKYEEIYSNTLALVPDFIKNEYPGISDYEWVCYNFMLTEDTDLMSDEEKEVARNVERKKSGSECKPHDSKSLPSDVISDASAKTANTNEETAPKHVEVASNAGTLSSKERSELKDFVSRKLDETKKEIFDYIDNL